MNVCVFKENYIYIKENIHEHMNVCVCLFKEKHLVTVQLEGVCVLKGVCVFEEKHLVTVQLEGQGQHGRHCAVEKRRGRHHAPF
jgi:hypothetical protein